MEKIDLFEKDIEASLLEKFLRYVVIDTQSQGNTGTFPSTSKQLDFVKLLLQEIKNLGVDKASIDEHGYLMASIPSNISPSDNAYQKVPAIGFIAHVDTAPEISGSNVKPQIIKNYQGGDLTLPGDPSVIIRTTDYPGLESNVGKTLITSDGTTLLGADNKAGIAIIMTLVEILMHHPEIKHGDIKMAFTPDEEIGEGMKFFDVKKFGAQLAYTVDGDNAPEINKETFCADTAIVTVYGRNTHHGKAKNIMVNAIRIMADIIALLPKKMSPETTENRQPHLHPCALDCSVEKTTATILLRAFEMPTLMKLRKTLTKIIDQVRRRYPKAKITLEIIESDRNMLEGIKKDTRVVDYLEEATEKAGLHPIWIPIRGGTDGSPLTAMGIPTPNLFVGSAGCHSKTEWASLWEMSKALETIFNLIQIWVEKAA